MWKYRIGDVVSHREYTNLNGIIIQQKISSEIEPDFDEDSSWYVIRWFSFPEGEIYENDTLVTTGQENEGQLILLEPYVNI